MCDGSPISTPEMVRALAEGMGKRCLLVKVDPLILKWCARLARKDSIYSQLCESIVISNEKACGLLGWRPETNTYDALKHLANSVKNSRSTLKH